MNSTTLPTVESAPPAQHGVQSGASSSQPVPRRNRTQLSCTSCRHSKLKCDRKEPCSQCTRRGRASQCTFPSPAIRKRPAVSMVNRVKQLESLVKDAMKTQPSATFPNTTPSFDFNPEDSYLSPKTGSPEAASHGQILLGNEQSTYVGATHWAAILENIEEVKSYFEEPAYVEEEEDDRPYTSLVFNAQSPATHDDLLNDLPPRITVDRLVSRYFNSNSPALHLIHKPTFQNEYRSFWEHPPDTPIAWLALLYSILTLGGLITMNSGDNLPGSPQDFLKSTHRYQECCIQSLLLSRYTKAGPYTLEALLIYLESEFLFSADDPVHCYLLIGNASRLALRMGLHRDSSKIRSDMIPFQAEMRRRIWSHLLQIDVLSSFHIGLPGILQNIESDTQYPRNLRDEDFDQETAELPPSRPETELTPMLYTICKSKLCHEAGKVITMANRLTAPAYSEVQELDSLLNRAYEAVSPHFRLDGPELPITDSPDRTIKRFSLGVLYQKSRCMLHRKQSHPESQIKSLSASLELLKYQRMVHVAASPGGPLAHDRWFLSALSLHDFLLAAMIVYLRAREQEDDREDMKKVLENSYAIWLDTGSWSRPSEAKKAAAVLAGMLKKVRGRIINPITGKDGIDAHSIKTLSLEGFSTTHGSMDPTSSVPGSSITESTPSSGLEMLYDSTLGDPLEGLMEFSNDFDWEMFDSQLRPQQTWAENIEDPNFIPHDFNSYS